MTRGLLGVLLGLAGALALAGCEESPPGRADEIANPALWEVTLANGQPAGWLFGTIHALPDETEWRTPAIERAIAKAGMLVVEVKDLDNRAKLSATFTRMSHSDWLPPLSERVTAADRPRLARLLHKGGYREADFKAIETWGAALMLARLTDSTEGENGVDRALVADFRARPIVELEGVQQQFAIFDSLPEADQRDLLGAVVEEDTMSAGDSTRLARLWLAGDMDAIASEGDDGLLADPQLRQALLTNRNRAWANRIDALLKAGRRPLVAVGAAHMAPPEGLPQLLAARGYKVVRVR